MKVPPVAAVFVEGNFRWNHAIDCVTVVMDGGELINVLGRMASGGAVKEREERTEGRDAGEQNLFRRSQLLLASIQRNSILQC